MIFAFLVHVLHEEHIVNQAEKTVTQAAIFLIILFVGKVFGHAALGGERVFEFVSAVSYAVEEALTCLISVFAEEVAEEVVHDIRRGLQVDVEPEVIVISQLIDREGQGGVKHTQQAVHRIAGDLPYSEEAEDVVNAIRIKVFGHLAETCLPPCKAIFVHLLPVVGGEAPVLALYREVIRRRTGLAIHIEQARLYPRIYAGARDTDRYVALNSYAVAVGVFMHMAHLLVKVVLQIAHIVYLMAVCLNEGIDLGGIIGCILAPLSKVGRAILVAQHAECSIRHKPLLILSHESLILVALNHPGALLCEDFVEIGYLALVDALIVNLWQGIELASQIVVVQTALGISQDTQLRQSQIHRVQSKARVGVVGVRIGPCVGHRGVVDGQYL